jgi:hypothetical protein
VLFWPASSRENLSEDISDRPVVIIDCLGECRRWHRLIPMKHAPRRVAAVDFYHIGGSLPVMWGAAVREAGGNSFSLLLSTIPEFIW